MMRKALIVSPRFPPISAPDMHRVRTSLPYFRSCGWDATVLCATPGTSDGVMEPALESTVPGDVRVERVDAWPEAACRRLGFGHFDYRCVVPLYRAGTRLLTRERFDLVYFSTTSFLTFALASPWKKRFGCRIVLDFQDPFHAGHQREPGGYPLPGGRLKYATSRALARIIEPRAVRSADGLVAVSPAYLTALHEAYPASRRAQTAAIPFGAPFADYECVARRAISQDVFDPADGRVHWIYLGVVPPHMWAVLKVFFAVLARIRAERPDELRDVRLHFAGTSYAAGGAARDVERLAREAGVGDLVTESPRRVPYLQALQALRQSDGVLVVGSVLRDYNPSKTLLCALSGRPVVAMLNAASPAVALARQSPNIRLACFQQDPSDPVFAQALLESLRWLAGLRGATFPDAGNALHAHSAEALAVAQCALFDRTLERKQDR
jgi:hypothetical protein